ncbi:helix-turn-helix domain-containing protein [Nocardioides sp. zg-536]|uniref:Helix-turn-helix domain-containing protein n=1 Tax=Nocardioides faecalis TaxID=2803858 RepID=A0A939BZW7_9ACTN|nr:helix-turn-helix domain-containing protein [Nocardioides faecalis]MBM9461728.1 helix-turn-helix domain-containing protein [Nocardioides faecalis]MBS4754729.1 helix-turn-helix domain-containing protein [Nocardioides faecalis]QVI59908.1 helix-turn-helix domain-containing protein [Nocardioides faecalis]
MSPTGPAERADATRQLRAASGSLGAAAIARMETDLAWFGALSAEDRSWVGMIVHAGVKGFVDWFADGGGSDPEQDAMIHVFGVAPRAMARVIDLRQTVELIRLTIDEVERNIERLLDAEVFADVHAGVLRYGREIAFATAEVYARAAEVRGRWDARLEALAVDAVLRAETDESVLSRASAVGWSSRGRVVVVAGPAPEEAAETQTGVFDEVRRAARERELDALSAVQGHLLVVILGGVTDPEKDAAAVEGSFGKGAVVVGPVAGDLSQAHVSATVALGALRAAVGWPDAPRPVSAHDLLPERILAGDESARIDAVEQVYRPLAEARGELVETLVAYFANGAGIEATARGLFVHANTVRYRLGQIGDLTGLTPSVPRDALALQLALILGRQAAL